MSWTISGKVRTVERAAARGLSRRRARRDRQGALRRELRHRARERRRVAGVHELLDPGEGVLDPAGVQRRLDRADDLLGVRRLRALAGVEQLLMELLAHAAPDDLDRDVHVGLEAGQ